MDIFSRITGGEDLRLSKALLIYTTLSAYRGNPASAAVASIHPVTIPREGQPFLEPGQPLSLSHLVDVLRSLQHVDHTKQLFPSGLLYFDASTVLWVCPSQYREIWFSTADKEFNRDVGGKKVRHPHLLFKATPEMLSVFALKERHPVGATPVFRAPYCNLYTSGDMCRGDVRLPDALSPESIPAWEKIFFESRFTHSNLHGKALTKHPQGHNGLWREMTLLEKEIFPSKHLVPLNMTVQDVLEKESSE